MATKKTPKKIGKREAARVVYVACNRGVMGQNYRIVFLPCAALADYWPLSDLTFDKFRAAQNVVNGVRAALVGGK
jgi:hypothetical protein